MKKIDLIDKKILYHLDMNARQPFSQIGKKVGLHKNVVMYRVKKLIDADIIKAFITNIDAFKLGFMSFRFLISFQYASEEKRNEIIKYFSYNPNIWYLALIEGPYDLILNFWVKDIDTFEKYWDKSLEKYRYYFKYYDFSIFTKTYHYIDSFLIEGNNMQNDRLKNEIINYKKLVSIDEIDWKILNQIASNARIPIVEIARNLNTTSMVVKYRLKQLMNKAVIQGFRLNINIAKLGLKYYTIRIQLKKYQHRISIINYVKLNPLVKMIDKSIGDSDLLIGIRSSSVDTIQKIIWDIEKQFPNCIKSFDYYYFSALDKLNFLPNKNEK